MTAREKRKALREARARRTAAYARFEASKRLRLAWREREARTALGAPDHRGREGDVVWALVQLR